MAILKKTARMLEAAKDIENEAAAQAYEDILQYVKDKEIIYSTYKEMVYYADAPSYVHDLMIADVKLTFEPETKSVSFEAYPTAPRSGKQYTRIGSGELYEFTFSTSTSELTYPVGIHAHYRGNCTLEITCNTDSYSLADWYVECMIHNKESNAIVRYKVDTPQEFENIITKAIDKLPEKRRNELKEYSQRATKYLGKLVQNN